MTRLAQRDPTLANDLARVEQRLRTLVYERHARAERHHHHAYARMWRTIADLTLGGKKMRSSLFIATLRGLGDEVGATPIPDALPADALNVACAIELFHTAFIVHDDVIDNDDVRRGIRNVSGAAVDGAIGHGADVTNAQRFGAASGILAGDALQGIAHALIAAYDGPRDTRLALVELIDWMVFESVAGEHADSWFSLGCEEAEPSRVLTTLELKTARYSFEAPLRLAAIIAQCPRARVDELGAIGRGLGVVYQLRDDVLGVFGSPDATGKTAMGDLREGTQTLLVALARESREWAEVAHRFGAPDLDEAGAESLREALRSSGALGLVERAITAEGARVRDRIVAARLSPGLERFLLTTLTRCSERVA